MAISNLTWILLVVFLVVNSLILAYFVNKYRSTKLRTSLYWTLTYLVFVLAILSSLILAFQDAEFEDVLEIQLPFVILGIAFLCMSVASTGLFGWFDDKVWEGIFGTLGVVASILNIVDSSISSYIFILLSIVAVVAYAYLSIKVEDYRILVISIGLLIQGISGRLATSGFIDNNGQLIINNLGQILIALGLIINPTRSNT